MGACDQALELVLVGVESDQVPLLLQPQGAALHADGPEPRQHQGTGILDPLKDLPRADVLVILDSQTLGG